MAGQVRREYVEGGEMVIEKIGVIASFLCLIHCVGMVVIVPTIPALGILFHDEGVEIVLWLIAGVTALWQIARTRGRLRILFLCSCVVGTVGLMFEWHLALHAGFVGIGIGQIIVLRRQKKIHSCSCEHNHD